MREIILDSETTGLDPASGHRIVEIGAVELIHRKPTGQHWHFYFNPERDVPREASAIHGLTAQFLADKPLFAQQAAAFLEFVGDAKLVAHNAGFDMKFINWELTQFGFQPLSMTRAVDTLEIARRKFPGAASSLDALCKRFGIDNSGRTLHGALLDAQLLAEIYPLLIGQQKNSLFGFLESEAVSTVAQIALTSERIQRPARLFTVPAEELAAHAAFVNRLGNKALWEKVS